MFISTRYLGSLLCLFILIFSTLTACEKRDAGPKASLERLLNQHKGNVIYVDFWASWCAPCRESLPWLAKMQRTYENEGFTVISINTDNQKQLADDFLKSISHNFPVIYDPKGKLATQFKVKGMPSSFIFDRSGKIAITHTGFLSHKKTQYQEELNALLSATQ